MNKTIEIFAGPNGSGKTTFSEIILSKRKNVIFYNSDKIAGGIAPVAKDAVQFEAGRFMLQNIQDSISKGESFSFETTFSGKLWSKHLRNAKATGYRVVIYFVFVKSVDISLKRIKNRVKNGGHDVAQKIVRRRYKRTFENMMKLYMPLANEWYIVDNSHSKGIVIAQCRKNKVQIFDNKTFKQYFQ